MGNVGIVPAEATVLIDKMGVTCGVEQNYIIFYTVSSLFSVQNCLDADPPILRISLES